MKPDTTGDDAGLLDDAYHRLADTGPEFEGFLSNHGPMAADAMIRLGHADALDTWIGDYRRRLEDEPGRRFAIEEADWREVLGDPSRLGDWCALFARLMRERDWDDVVREWWPRLLPGAIAAATHCLIRTGHAVRALREEPTDERREELGRALGYWAARWQPLPGPDPRGSLGVEDALARVPGIGSSGGTRTRLAPVAASPDWPDALARLRSPAPDADIPTALDTLVDAAVTGYHRWAPANPVMLVHAATGPRAIGLLLPVLPVDRRPEAYDMAWRICAAISAAYRTHEPPSPPVGPAAISLDEVGARAVATGDEHAIKFTEVAVESHRRGNPYALAAAARSAELLG